MRAGVLPPPDRLLAAGDLVDRRPGRGRPDVGAAVVFEPRDRGTPLVEVGVGLIQPAMYEIGRLWQASRVSIAQEHLATAISECLLAQAVAAAEFAPPVRRKAMFACVQGNHHPLGVRVVSDAFEIKSR